MDSRPFISATYHRLTSHLCMRITSGTSSVYSHLPVSGVTTPHTHPRPVRRPIATASRSGTLLLSNHS
jgi:hypothetical protein